MNRLQSELSGLRVTVMGLGVHGGGLATAIWLHRHGALVTVTDLRDEASLASGLEQLPETIRTVIGRHEMDDFRMADLVVKNPAVPRHVPFLAEAGLVTTDIGLFLWRWQERLGSARGPLIAVTGTKGKSGTSSAAAHIVSGAAPGARLGGNITVSPLRFVEELAPGDPVILELSSFQLGDLAWCRTHNATVQPSPSATAFGSFPAIRAPIVPATAAVITTIFRDHQDYYGSMDAYVRDKREIYRDVTDGGTVILSATNEWSASFRADLQPRVEEGSITLLTELDGERLELLPANLRVPGIHNRTNVTMAALCARAVGTPRDVIRERAASFTGVAHRLETVARCGAITWINDSAATIPEAAHAAVVSSVSPVILIAGGSDKGLDPAPIVAAGEHAVSHGGAVLLLEGTATTAIGAALTARGVPWDGPFDTLRAAVDAAHTRAMRAGAEDKAGAAVRPTVEDSFTENARSTVEDSSGHPQQPAGVTVLLSPGCASFGMFRNEFDRGDQFRALAREKCPE